MAVNNCWGKRWILIVDLGSSLRLEKFLFSSFGEPIMLLLSWYLTHVIIARQSRDAIASAASGGGREGEKRAGF
jgi:hypothetical protein